MVPISRCLASLAVLFSVDGARVAKKRSSDFQAKNTKFIAGVPVVNYHVAYGGKSSLSAHEESLEEEWIVMMQPGTTDAQLHSLCKAYKHGCKMVGHPDKGGVPFLDLRGTERDLAAVIEASQGTVKLVEPDQTLHMIPELEADPNSSPSWGLDRVGAGGRGGNEGAGVSIFILDTGVRTTHQDFEDRAIPQVDFTDGNKECNGDLQCAADRQGHGTHCAGTAGGKTFGVAPQARVHGVKVLGDNGAGSLTAIIGSIDYLAAYPGRPAVGSMSLGGQCPFGWCFLYQAIKTAIDQAVASGVTMVVAGGNSDADSCGFMPAFVPSAITVGATDSNDARSHFSNWGSCTKIWAPGSSITSATHEDDTGSKTFSGTSMACPHVAGGAALVLELNPDFSPEKVLQRLHANAATDYITDLKPDDTNKLLYVASDAPPPPGGAQAVKVQGNTSLAGSCTSADWAHKERLGNNAFAEQMWRCAHSSVSWWLQWQKAKFIACAEGTGLSNGCARCYEGAGKWGFDNCPLACRTSFCSSGCLSCGEPYRPTITACAGRPLGVITPC